VRVFSVGTDAVLFRTVLAATVVAACAETPEDRTAYRLVLPDAGASGALGEACDDAHRCPAPLYCLLPAECRREPDAAVGPTDGQAAVGDRCDEVRPCAPGLRCERLSDVGACSLDCEEDGDCPGPAVCWLARGPAQGACVPDGGLIGDACAVENDCQAGLRCEDRMPGGYCTRACDRHLPCPDGMEAVCTRLSEGQGNACLRRCGDPEVPCRDGVPCRPMTQAAVLVCAPST